MVNTNFYKTVNSLMSFASGAGVPEVVDYATFIEAGKTILQMDGESVQNGFINPLMNKIGLSINVVRSYEGSYKELTRGTLEYGDTIEMIMNYFYDTQAAVFNNLVDGQSIDQYEINKPKAEVSYFVDSNSFDITRTIQRVELEKAFSGPAAMDKFITGITTYVVNSAEEAREVGRIALVGKLIIDLDASNAATSDNAPATKYNLVTMYNALTGAELTSDNCLYNEEFVKYAVAVIKKVMGKTEKASASYNLKGLKTFTPASGRHLFVNSALTSAMDTYIRTDNYNPEFSVLTDYINVPYWQDEDAPFVVKSKTGAEGETVTSSPVVAVFCDEYAIGEYLRTQAMEQSPYNARGRYWNMFLHVEVKYVENTSANAVLFTLA